MGHILSDMSRPRSQTKKGPGRPRADEQEFRNQAILDAATEVFLEQGFAHARTDEIARRANASKQTLYSRYPSKAKLFAALVKRRSEKLIDPVAAAIFHDDHSPADEVLYRYGVQVLQATLSDEGQRLRRLLIAEAPRFRNLAKGFWQNGPGRGRELLKQYLTMLADRRVLAVDDFDFATEQFLGMVLGGPGNRSNFGLPSLFLTEAALGKWVRSCVNAFLKAYRYEG